MLTKSTGVSLLASLLSVFLVIGCSRMDLALSLAPRFMSSELDELFDLSSRTKDEVRSEAEKILPQIYENCLKGDLETLETTLRSLEKSGLSEFATKASSLASPVRACLNKALELPTERFVGALSAEQIQNFVIELKDRNDEQLKQKKLEDRAFARFSRTFEFLCRDLDGEEEQIAKTFFATHAFPWGEVQKRRNDFIQELQGKSDLETQRRLVLNYFLDRFRREPSQEQLEYQVALAGLWTRLISNSRESGFSDCRQRVLKRIEQLRDHFKKNKEQK